jgi:hypothetical protein
MTLGDALGPEGKRPALYGIGGWLAFLCVTLLFLTPAAVLIQLTRTVLVSDLDPMELGFEIGLDVAFAAFAVFAGIGLVRMWPKALRNARLYYSVNLALGLLLPVFGFVPPSGAAEVMLGLRVAGVSTAWLLYLYLSERVQNTYSTAHAQTVSDVFR